MANPMTPFADQFRCYIIGDPVQIFLGDHHGEMTEGRVVHIFYLYDTRFYVIEIETAMDSIFEVRTGHRLGMRPSNGAMEYESWSKQ